jgi:hypothetical protein
VCGSRKEKGFKDLDISAIKKYPGIVATELNSVLTKGA